MTGDFIVHHLSPHHDKAVESGTWEKVKDIIDQSTALVEKHFPDKMVLFSIGNNDGWHSQAPDEGQKATLYGYLHDLWFANYPGNHEIADSVKDTFMSAGYYRADLSPSISVLNLNYEYMEYEDDTSY